MTCLNCGATTSNGLALCELCRRSVEVDLEFLPTYFANLSRWKPGRTSSRQVPGSRPLWDGEPKQKVDRIADRIDDAYECVTEWAAKFTRDQPTLPRPLTLADAALVGELADQDDPVLMFKLLCEAFTAHLAHVGTRTWAGTFTKQIGHHEERLRILTEDVIPGWYAGGCRRCGYATYVVPGLTWVTCGHCGANTYARDHLEVILTEARDWIALPKRLAEAVVALVDTEQSVNRLRKRITKWGARNRLRPYRARKRDHVWDAFLDKIVVADVDHGPVRYRLGDVLDELVRAGATPLTGAVVDDEATGS